MFRENIVRRSRVKELVCQVYDTLDFASRHPISSLRKIAHEPTIEFITKNCMWATAQRFSRGLVDISLSQVEISGMFLEFGVFKGASIRYIAGHAKDREIYGFDSFTGLPEAWIHYPKNYFSLGGNLPKVPSNVTLHKGYFEDTLPSWIERHSGNIALMHIDCDLYSSTKTIFKYLKDRIKPGAVIILITRSGKNLGIKLFLNSLKKAL
ncbi:MAG: TylF/MycF/NovP-related O-methyltransferase [Anaerolineae bacterium]